VDPSMDERLREIEARYRQVQAEMASPTGAPDPTRLRELGRAFADLREIAEPYREYLAAVGQAAEAVDLAGHESDPEMGAFLRQEAAAAEKRAEQLRRRLESLLVPRDPNDGKNVVMEIRAGAGGQEAALWAGALFEMCREAYSRLKHEAGVHRVQRVPVTESSGRVHTSTATVAVMPEAEEVEVEIRPEDLDVDVFRSTGPGGQSVNTTDSAVRITHLPTGIVVACQEERSQMQNRDKAMRYLRTRLLQRAQEEAHRKAAAERRSQVGTGERAEKIRTYNFPEGRVTDHRVKLTSHQLQDVLAGDLDRFVEALLAAERAEQLAAGGGVGERRPVSAADPSVAGR